MRLPQHQAQFPAVEFALLQENIHHMVDALDTAVHQSNDPPDAGPFLSVVERRRNGTRGRPRIEIEKTYLQETFHESGDATYGEVATAANCDTRTVRRRQQDYGHLPLGEPVYVDEFDETGGRIGRRYQGRGRPPTTNLTDEQLDNLLSECLRDFPQFGRHKIAGWLRDRGHHVTDDRLREVYVHVHGALGVFGNRSVHRKCYHVMGANSLWHHDGQHGNQTLCSACVPSIPI